MRRPDWDVSLHLIWQRFMVVDAILWWWYPSLIVILFCDPAWWAMKWFLHDLHIWWHVVTGCTSTYNIKICINFHTRSNLSYVGILSIELHFQKPLFFALLPSSATLIFSTYPTPYTPQRCYIRIHTYIFQLMPAISYLSSIIVITTASRYLL